MISYKLTWEGRPVDALRQAIKLRQKVIGDSGKDAVYGTAITALISIRSMTAVAKTSRIKNSDIQVKDVTGAYVPGFKVGHKRVLRIGGRSGAYLEGTPKNLMGGMGKVRVLMPKYHKGEQPRAFWAKYSAPWRPIIGVQGTRVVHDMIGYFIAESEAQVRNDIKSRVVRRVRTYSKLAQNAISVAIGKLGRRASMGGGSKAQRTARKMANVTKRETDTAAWVSVVDELGYSIQAVKGGQAGVDLALKRAANKVVGRIIRWADEHRLGGHGIEVPFPEIRRQGAFSR